MLSCHEYIIKFSDTFYHHLCTYSKSTEYQPHPSLLSLNKTKTFWLVAIFHSLTFYSLLQSCQITNSIIQSLLLGTKNVPLEMQLIVTQKLMQKVRLCKWWTILHGLNLKRTKEPYLSFTFTIKTENPTYKIRITSAIVIVCTGIAFDPTITLLQLVQ